MEIQLNSKNLFKWWFRLLVLLICLPLGMAIPSMVRMPLQILTVGLFVLALAFIRKPQYLVSFFFLLFVSFLYYIGSWNEAMPASSFFFNSICGWEILVYTVLCLKKVVKVEKETLWIILIMTGITAVTTIIGTDKYPLAVREAVRRVSYSGEDISQLKQMYKRHNIAGWHQMYGMVFFQGTFVYLWKKYRSKLILLIIILTEISVLKSQIAFAMIISIIILFLTVTNIRVKDYCVLPLGCCLALPVLYAAFDPILSLVIEVSEAHKMQMLTRKLQDLYSLMVLHTSTGDASERFRLYGKSLDGFFRYPFGLFMHPDVQAGDYIGFHSEFFDFIGTLGVFGICLIITGLVFWLFQIRKMKDPYDARFLLYIFITFVFLFILNPVFYAPQIWVGAFILPVSAVMLQNDDCEMKSKKILWRSGQIVHNEVPGKYSVGVRNG